MSADQNASTPYGNITGTNATPALSAKRSIGGFTPNPVGKGAITPNKLVYHSSKKVNLLMEDKKHKRRLTERTLTADVQYNSDVTNHNIKMVKKKKTGSNSKSKSRSRSKSNTKSKYVDDLAMSTRQQTPTLSTHPIQTPQKQGLSANPTHQNLSIAHLHERNAAHHVNIESNLNNAIKISKHGFQDEWKKKKTHDVPIKQREPIEANGPVHSQKAFL